jgi:hypothetical protein
MFRPATARSALRLIPSCNASVARSTLPNGFLRAQLTTSSRQLTAKNAKTFALAARKPTTALTRYLSTTARLSDEKKEVLNRAKQEIPADPAAVSTQSTIRPVLHEQGIPEEEPDVDMMAGVRSDFVLSTLYFDFTPLVVTDAS